MGPAELEFFQVAAGSFRLGGSCATIDGLGELPPGSAQWIDSRLSIPDGLPHGNETEFLDHLEPLENGIILSPDTYEVEFVRTACKLGDGGEAICGDYEWPTAWLSLSPRYRVPLELVEESLFEFLETAQVGPVRL